MRDVLCRCPERYPLENYFIPYTTTLSLNWPYSDAAMWREAPPRNPPNGEQAPRTGGHEPYGPEAPPTLLLSPAFEAHIRDLSNWSLGPAFLRQYSELCEDVRIEPS